MSPVHRYAGLAAAFLFLVLGLWGILSWFRNRHPGPWFWHLLAAGQVGVGLQAVVGIVLFALGGRRPVLHYAYGAFPIFVLVVAHRWSRRLEGLEWAPFTGAGLVIFGLLLRGFMTGTGA